MPVSKEEEDDAAIGAWIVGFMISLGIGIVLSHFFGAAVCIGAILIFTPTLSLVLWLLLGPKPKT
jgi:hypothetical protein